MEKRDDYKFLKLKDAIPCINQKVNLIGVILEYGQPRKTRGTDFSCNLKIADESHTIPGVQVNLFAESMDMLPRVASPGDIILLSRVTMKKHGEVCAVFNKKFSSFALYEGNDCDDFIPYQTYSKFSSREQDKKLISCLRNWSTDFKLDGGPTNYLLLRELKEEKHINLLCKVLHKCKLEDNNWVVFLWDSTDVPPRGLVTPLRKEMDNPLPLHLGEVSLSRDTLCTFPVVGSILRVEVDQRCSKHVLHGMEIGTWVKLLNVSCKVEAGLWHVVVTQFSKLRCMANEDSLVLQRLRNVEERLSYKLGRMPYWSFPWPSHITEVDHDDVPSVSLMEILTYREVTAKFKTTVRFLAAHPWRVEDFRTPSGIYKVRFTIEDSTARIRAYVYAEDGDEFFGNFDVDALTRKRNMLLGVAGDGNGNDENIGHGRNPPWVQCCIKSYYVDKQNKWESRNYRIFDTKVVLLPDRSSELSSSCLHHTE